MPKDYNFSLFWTLQIGGWIAFGIGMTLARIGEYSPAVIVASQPVFVAIGFLVTLGLRWLYARLSDANPSPLGLLIASVIASYAASVVWTAGYDIYWRTTITTVVSVLSAIPLYVRPGPLLDNVLYNTFVLLAWSILYFGIKYYQAMLEARERALRAEAQAQRAQLRALRYQLNPHFLFNTMNAISTLVGEERNREARGMIARLSDFLRLALEGDGPAEVPLADEIEFVRRYLEIEQIRFRERLRVRIDVADEVLSASVPVLILQPLVENAIRYAVSPREEGADIIIKARLSGGDLLLSVTDNGPGLTKLDSESSPGIGLANTRERLRELHGAKQSLELELLDSGGLRVVIRIPLRTAPRLGSRLMVAQS